MARIDNVTIEVGVRPVISRESAELCLKMVQFYCNENSVYLCAERMDDGTHKFFFEDKGGK